MSESKDQPINMVERATMGKGTVEAAIERLNEKGYRFVAVSNVDFFSTSTYMVIGELVGLSASTPRK